MTDKPQRAQDAPGIWFNPNPGLVLGSVVKGRWGRLSEAQQLMCLQVFDNYGLLLPTGKVDWKCISRQLDNLEIINKAMTGTDDGEKVL